YVPIGDGDGTYAPCDSRYDHWVAYMTANRFGGVFQGNGPHWWRCVLHGNDSYYARDSLHAAYFVDGGYNPFLPCWWSGCWHDGNTGGDYVTGNPVWAWEWVQG